MNQTFAALYEYQLTYSHIYWVQFPTILKDPISGKSLMFFAFIGQGDFMKSISGKSPMKLSVSGKSTLLKSVTIKAALTLRIDGNSKIVTNIQGKSKAS